MKNEYSRCFKYILSSEKGHRYPTIILEGVKEKYTTQNKQTKKLLRSFFRQRKENILIDGEMRLFTFDDDIFDR